MFVADLNLPYSKRFEQGKFKTLNIALSLSLVHRQFVHIIALLFSCTDFKATNINVTKNVENGESVSNGFEFA